MRGRIGGGSCSSPAANAVAEQEDDARAERHERGRFGGGAGADLGVEGDDEVLTGRSGLDLRERERTRDVGGEGLAVDSRGEGLLTVLAFHVVDDDRQQFVKALDRAIALPRGLAAQGDPPTVFLPNEGLRGFSVHLSFGRVLQDVGLPGRASET